MIANPIRAREPFSPDFSFVSFDHQKISNSSLRGREVLLAFWNTWCCKATLPSLQKLQQEYAGKPFELISISTDDEQVWRTFIESEHMNWTQYLDSPRQISETFRVESFPTYIVLDKDGVMRFRKVGSFPSYLMLASNGRVLLDQSRQWVGFQKELEEAINKELKRPPDPKLANAAPVEGNK